MHREELIKKVESYGWTDLGNRNSVSMLSFERGHYRANIYRTGTITIQDKNKRHDKGIRGSMDFLDILK